MKMDTKKEQKYLTQYVAVLSASLVSLMAGVSFSWTSPSLPLLLNQENHFNLTSEDGSYIAIAAPLGSMIATPLAAWMVDAIGRKNTILFVALPQFLSFLFFYFFKTSLAFVYIGRLLGGVGEGFCFTVIAMYIAEIAHPSIRGNLCSYVSLTLRLGVLVINVVGSFCSITTTSLIFLSVPLAFLASFIFMPESPYYLLMNEDKSGARKSLQFLRRKSDVEDELQHLVHDVQRQMSERGKYKDVFIIGSNRRALTVSVGLRIFQQFTGYSAFTMYTQILVSDAVGNVSPVICSIVLACTQFGVTFVSSSIVDRTGRKPLLITSCSTCFLILLIASVFFALRDFTTINVESVKYLPLVCLVLFIVMFCLGIGTLVNVVLGELFSTSVKPKALCITNIVFGACMMSSTKFFQVINDWKGLSISFFVFAMFSLVGVGFSYYCVPETKAKTLEEIQQKFKKRSGRATDCA